MPISLQGFLDTSPSLCGEIARYINSRQETDQPGIALASAISFMGALKSARIKSPHGIAPSIYTCAIAPSGIGKTKAQQAIVDICTACNLTSFLMGKPASDSALLNSLGRSSRQFLIWDEFGLALSEMSQSKSSYRVAILSVLMDLFSAAGRPYIGKEYADKDRVNIQAPYLSLMVASTPNRFYDALSRDMIEDGFLSRWLVFEGERSLNFKTPGPSEVPIEITQRVSFINEGKELKEGPALKRALQVEQVPLVFSDPSYVEVIRGIARDKLILANSELESVFWSRSFEHTMKLCMIFSDLQCKCDTRTVLYCWQLVEFLVTNLINRCNVDIHDTHGDRTKSKRHKKFISLIGPGECISRAELTKKALNWGFDKDERKKRIEDLIENEIWFESTQTNPSTHRTSIYYSRKRT